MKQAYFAKKLAQISHFQPEWWFKDFAGSIWSRHRLLYFITNIKVTNMKEIQQGNLLMRKLTSRDFGKCGTYWACEVLNRSYCCSKSEDCEILAPLAKIRGVAKNRNASIPAIFFSEFEITLTAYNYGLLPLNLENYHIFGMIWTCPFPWYHPRQVIPFQNFEFQFPQFFMFEAKSSLHSRRPFAKTLKLVI